MQGCCHYCPPTKLWEGNVVLSRVCSQGGSHVTIINAVLEITVQGLLHVGPQVPPALVIPLLVASGGHHWRPAKACSLQNPPPGWSWHLVAFEAGAVSESGLYASYWNAFLVIISYKIESTGKLKKCSNFGQVWNCITKSSWLWTFCADSSEIE